MKFREISNTILIVILIVVAAPEVSAEPNFYESTSGCDQGKTISFDAEKVEARIIPPVTFRNTRDNSQEVVYSKSYQIVIVIPKNHADDVLRFSLKNLQCTAEVRLGNIMLETEIISQIFPASVAGQISRFIDLTPSKTDFEFDNLQKVVKHSSRVVISIR